MTRPTVTIALACTLLLPACGSVKRADEAFRDGAPQWDDASAHALVDKYVIIGLTYEAPDGAVVRLEQLHGRIRFADAARGLCVALEGQKFGLTFWMPPDLRPITAATPGDYRLRSTGEVIVDPDLVATWIVTEHTGTAPSVELQGVGTGRCPNR